MITARYGMGDISESDLAAAGVGASIPTLFMAGAFLYLLFAGSAATERRDELRRARADYEEKVKKIKAKPRIRV